MLYVYAFDVDGCTSQAKRRDWMLEPAHPDWDAYHADSINDEPYPEMAQFIRSIRAWGDHWDSDVVANNMIHIWTARPEKWRQLTIEWFNKHYIPFDVLFMRLDNDLRPAHVIKTEWLRRVGSLPDVSVQLVFDDSSKNVKAMQEMGIGQICQVNHRHNLENY